MEITHSQAQGRVPIMVLQPHGNLDATNYQTLIAKGREVVKAGARDILIDLSQVPYTSSAGLVALHSIAKLLRGEPSSADGWEAIRSIHRESGQGLQQHVKLLNPQPNVNRVLEMAGLKQYFEVYADLAAAVAAF